MGEHDEEKQKDVSCIVSPIVSLSVKVFTFSQSTLASGNRFVYKSTNTKVPGKVDVPCLPSNVVSSYTQIA